MPSKSKETIVFVLSDATGETAERMVRAGFLQFDVTEPQIVRMPEIRKPEQLDEIFQRAKREAAVVVHTFVQKELREAAFVIADTLQIPAVDLIGPILGKLETYFGRPPRAVPGLLHQFGEVYFRRIEAIEYTVKHDDGLGLNTLDGADIVIAGVSRTSKTPLSIYLANEGYRVANIPLVAGIPPPRELQEYKKKNIVGLLINPDQLSKIREQRLKKLGSKIRTGYTDLEQIAREVADARKLYQERGWPTIDVTGKAVEEIATETLVKLGLR